MPRPQPGDPFPRRIPAPPVPETLAEMDARIRAENLQLKQIAARAEQAEYYARRIAEMRSRYVPPPGQPTPVVQPLAPEAQRIPEAIPLRTGDLADKSMRASVQQRTPTGQFAKTPEAIPQGPPTQAVPVEPPAGQQPPKSFAQFVKDVTKAKQLVKTSPYALPSIVASELAVHGHVPKKLPVVGDLPYATFITLPPALVSGAAFGPPGAVVGALATAGPIIFKAAKLGINDPSLKGLAAAEQLTERDPINLPRGLRELNRINEDQRAYLEEKGDQLELLGLYLELREKGLLHLLDAGPPPPSDKDC